MCITRILKKSFLLISMILGISHIYAIELNSTNITQPPFNCGISDIACYLSSKGITSIAPGTFDNHINLEIVDLTYNSLTTLPAHLFDNNIYLSQFAVYGNQLTTLPDGLFDNNPNLDYFSPALNQLTTLPDGLFDNNPNLRNLNLVGNKISSLPDNIFANISAFNSLRLENNKLTSLPSSLLSITNMNIFRVLDNCFDITAMPILQTNYINTYSTDLSLWSNSQNNCSVDFSLYFNFMNNPIIAGSQNVLAVSMSQSLNNPSSGNYIDIFGLEDIMNIDLIQNPGWIALSGGGYRYNISDSSSSFFQTFYLTGVVSPEIGGNRVSFTGMIFTNTREIFTGNNIFSSQFYISPVTDYFLTGINVGTGVSGDVISTNFIYDKTNVDFYSTDSIVKVSLGTGISLSSGGDWKTSSMSGGLFYSGDICYNALRDEKGPYYQKISQYFYRQGYSSLDSWLVDNFGITSNSSQEIENLYDVCVSHGYSSLRVCLVNFLGISFSNQDYPQCGSEKSFLMSGDMCYDDFLQETGTYFTSLESVVLNRYGVSSLNLLLQLWFGVPSDPSQASENLILVCTDDNYFGYDDLESCLINVFGMQVTDYNATCGIVNADILFTKLLTPFSGSLNIDFLLSKNLLIGESISSRISLYPSVVDLNFLNNELNYLMFSPIIDTGIIMTGVSGGGRGSGLSRDNCPDGDNSNNYYDLSCGKQLYVCSQSRTLQPIIDSTIIDTSEFFKKALGFLYTYDMTRYQSVDEFNPYTALTREQAAKFFSQFALNVLCRQPDTSLNINYKDNYEIDLSLSEYILKSYQLGLMKGGTDGYFRPKDYITKAEFNTIIIRLLGQKYLGEDDKNLRYSEYLKYAGDFGLSIDDFSDQLVLRYDSALIFNKLLK